MKNIRNRKNGSFRSKNGVKNGHKPADNPNIAWNDEFYITIHEMAKQGHSQRDIAAALGVSPVTLCLWKKENPVVAKCLGAGKNDQDMGVTLRDYIFDRLPDHLQDLWKDINRCEDYTNPTMRIEALLENAGKKARQHLFLYALVDACYNPSEACRKVCISRVTMHKWLNEDPEFAQLIEQIHWHKKNFFEGALVNLVRRGDPSATIFVNRTINKDRGYGEKIEITATVDHTHRVVGLEELHNLPVEDRRKILDALQNPPPPKQLPPPDVKEVIDQEEK